MNNKGSGWHNESNRHALAARGIKTNLRARGREDDSLRYHNLSCADRLDNEYKNRMEGLRSVWEGYQSGDDKAEDFYNYYGLSFDYVAPHTFGDEQHEGYFRYQLSWGGPSDEFRFYVGPGYELHRIEYWFMDWYDGASRTLTGDDYDLLEEIFQWFDEIGTTESEYEKSREY